MKESFHSLVTDENKEAFPKDHSAINSGTWAHLEVKWMNAILAVLCVKADG